MNPDQSVAGAVKSDQEQASDIIGEKLAQLCPNLNPPQPSSMVGRQRDNRWQVRMLDTRRRWEYYLRVDFAAGKEEVVVTASAWCNGREIYRTAQGRMPMAGLSGWLDTELAECIGKYEADRFPVRQEVRREMLAPVA
jgi:hypothetical protein